MNKRLTRVVAALLAVVIVGLGSFTALQFQSMSEEVSQIELSNSFVYPTPKRLPQFKLMEQHGTSFTNADLKGKWSLFFIGYTSCPDVCPTTMAKLTAAYPELLESADIQVIFLSVDPQRDTQDKLLNYMDFFNPKFIALTGDHTQLFPLTRSLGFVYAMVGDGENYQIDHSASMALISPEGENIAIIKPKSSTPGTLPQITSQALISDIHQIIQRKNG
ncbi:electron transport protein SCO1/SenC [Shewanella sediminis HAW-EB3]|uniref:Electron transport protein SCO1/SenC n=1 Tax=Shewanella sediminis (strain HAW-EB3) TaxID=425104 RepID=A8FPM9_SHESH|nr:SCO family protein [Shewanella sediminis]ABV34802.1 electron transport protein SCO1/SenC [Shewanella sediminis HAW-EB3]